MCIRDSINLDKRTHLTRCNGSINGVTTDSKDDIKRSIDDCLLYTSDAADERSSVDLGGRRIIKKKKQRKYENEIAHQRKN